MSTYPGSAYRSAPRGRTGSGFQGYAPHSASGGPRGSGNAYRSASPLRLGAKVARRFIPWIGWGELALDLAQMYVRAATAGYRKLSSWPGGIANGVVGPVDVHWWSGAIIANPGFNVTFANALLQDRTANTIDTGGVSTTPGNWRVTGIWAKQVAGYQFFEYPQRYPLRDPAIEPDPRQYPETPPWRKLAPDPYTPALDPLTGPGLGEGFQIYPRGLPFGAWRFRQYNPYRASEQPEWGNALPHVTPVRPLPQPRPRPEPDIVIFPYGRVRRDRRGRIRRGAPGSRVLADLLRRYRLNTHRNLKVMRRIKEKKIKGSDGTWRLIKQVVNTVTETEDFVGALWDNLPPGAQTKKKGEQTTPQQKLADLYKSWDRIDLVGALGSLIKNQIVDFAFGYTSQESTKAAINAGWTSLFGPGTGPWDGITVLMMGQITEVGSGIRAMGDGPLAEPSYLEEMSKRLLTALGRPTVRQGLDYLMSFGDRRERAQFVPVQRPAQELNPTRFPQAGLTPSYQIRYRPKTRS